MKRLQLPKNKLARLAINIVFVPVWAICATLLWKLIDKLLFLLPLPFYDLWRASFVWHATYNNDSVFYSGLLLVYGPIVLASRYIWWGRIRPRRRITTSMDD